MAFLANNRRQGVLALILVSCFALLGWYFGNPPDSMQSSNFGTVLRIFALEDQTRTIVVVIIVDVVTGVIAALRLGIFDTQRLAGFMATSVVPYLLGYMLFWFLTYFGLINLLPAGIASALASLSYGAIMASLTVSIVDNLTRARLGTVPPNDGVTTDQPPANPQG